MGNRRQVGLLEALTPGEKPGKGGELVDGGDQRGRCAGPGDLLDHDHRGQGVGADPVVRLGNVRGVKVGRLQRLEGCLGKLRELVGLRSIRRDLLRTQLPDRGAESLVLLRWAVEIAKLAHRGSVTRSRPTVSGCDGSQSSGSNGGTSTVLVTGTYATALIASLIAIITSSTW